MFRTLWYFVLCSLTCYAVAQNRFTVSVVETEGEIPEAREGHASSSLHTQDGYFIIIYGGKGLNKTFGDTWTYGVNDNSWQLLEPPNLNLKNEKPPPMHGAISGYRYVEGYLEPFLYVTLGRGDEEDVFYNEMWAMEFRQFTWKKVKLEGNVPSPRYNAAGGLELFAKHDETFQAELIVTHGFGKDGPLSDAYRCKFDPVDPYKATWIRIHDQISKYSLFNPQPVHMQASTFTAKRDLVLFGGCYSSKNTAGYCPSNAAWQLETHHDGREFSSPDGDDGYRYSWSRLSSEPPARVGASMAQALSSFESGYEAWSDIAVLYGGLQNHPELNANQIISATKPTNNEIALYSAKNLYWIREEVSYKGLESLKNTAETGRSRSSMNIVRKYNSKTESESEEFYLLFGGRFEDGSYTDSMLKLSFDSVSFPRKIAGTAKLWTFPQVHGIIMFFSFGVLPLIAGFVFRYFREKRRKSMLFRVHIGIKISVLIFAWIAVFLVRYGRNYKTPRFTHAYIGYIILSLVTIQPLFTILSGSWRSLLRKDSEEDFRESFGQSSKFSTWRFLYRIIGLGIIGLGLANVTLGILSITSPLLLWVHWAVYVIVVLVIVFWMELSLLAGREYEYGISSKKVRGFLRNRTSESFVIPPPISARFRTGRLFRNSSISSGIFSNRNSSVPYFTESRMFEAH